MIGMLLPELVIYNSLISIIKMLRVDLEEHSDDETHSILYRLFSTDEQGNPLQINLMNIYTQAKKIITNKGNLSVNYGYNQKVAQNISLHIILPQENSTMAIGADEGYLSEYTKDADGNVISENMYLTQMYKSTYQIMITSNNSAEVMIVYNILKSMLLMLVPQLELMGLRTPTFSGNDIVMQDDLSPVPIFHKVINISFQYEHNVPQHIVRDAASRFYVRMRAVLDGDDKDTPIPEPEKRTLQILSNGKYGVYSIDEVDVKVLPIYEERTVTITQNGTYEILPESADALSRVEVEVEVNILQEILNHGYKFAFSSTLTNFSEELILPANCSYLFYGCLKLVTCDLSNVNADSVTNLNSAFANCTSLTTLDTSNWDLSGVTNLNSAFANCTSLTTLDTSNWNVDLSGTYGTFQRTNLVKLDCSTWKVINVSNTFNGSNNLRTIIGDHTLQEVEDGKVVCFEGATSIDLDGGIYLRYSSVLACLKAMNNLSGRLWLPKNCYNNCFNDDDTTPDATTLAERQAEIAAICVNKKKILQLGG